MSETHFYEPRHGHGLPHDPFKAIVAPRPIGWISTVDAAGRPNLAPYSFFNAFCEAPPIVGFSSGGRKDSQRNAEATGEFVVNLATRKHARAMNLTSAPFPPGVNEFEAAGLALGLLRGWPLDETNRRAAEVAAFVCSRPGGAPELTPDLCRPYTD